MSDSARFKDFDAAIAEETREPIRFQLGGREWTAVHVSVVNLLRLAREINAGNAVLGYDDCLRSMLDEAAREEFTATLAECNVSVRMLMDIVNWITETASAVPFDEPSSSQEQQSKTGNESRVVSLSGGSHSKGSRSATG